MLKSKKNEILYNIYIYSNLFAFNYWKCLKIIFLSKSFFKNVQAT